MLKAGTRGKPVAATGLQRRGPRRGRWCGSGARSQARPLVSGPSSLRAVGKSTGSTWVACACHVGSPGCRRRRSWASARGLDPGQGTRRGSEENRRLQPPHLHSGGNVFDFPTSWVLRGSNEGTRVGFPGGCFAFCKSRRPNVPWSSRANVSQSELPGSGTDGFLRVLGRPPPTRLFPECPVLTQCSPSARPVLAQCSFSAHQCSSVLTQCLPSAHQCFPSAHPVLAQCSLTQCSPSACQCSAQALPPSLPFVDKAAETQRPGPCPGPPAECTVGLFSLPSLFPAPNFSPCGVTGWCDTAANVLGFPFTLETARGLPRLLTAAARGGSGQAPGAPPQP